jgi:hypothetical protein
MQDVQEIVSVIRDGLDDAELAKTIKRCVITNTWRLRSILNIERTAHYHQWLEIHVRDMPAYWNRCGRLPKGIAKHLIQLRVTAHLKTGLLTQGLPLHGL